MRNNVNVPLTITLAFVLLGLQTTLKFHFPMGFKAAVIAEMKINRSSVRETKPGVYLYPRVQGGYGYS